jgi:hypothetical protein
MVMNLTCELREIVVVVVERLVKEMGLKGLKKKGSEFENPVNQLRFPPLDWRKKKVKHDLGFAKP